MPVFGLPLGSKPFAPGGPIRPSGEAPGTTGSGKVPDASSEDEIRTQDEVTEAGFWMGFNIAELPAYLLLAQDNFFSPFGYVLFAALLPVALVFGLIGIIVAKIAVARSK